MSFINIFYNSNLKENLSNKENTLLNDLSFNVNHPFKCNLKNKFGIITPQITDDFLADSFISTNKDKESKENIEKDLANENTTNKTYSNKIPLNENQSYIKKIMYDYSETLIPCKPNLNIAASKAIIKEYSHTKKYLEDKLILISSTEEEKIKKSQKIEKEFQKISEPEEENDDLEQLLKYQEKHLPVPLSKKDNEKFKILKMKQMKRISMPPNKSVRKFAEDIEPIYEKEFRILNSFSSMKKRKPVHSTRRIYSSNYFLYKEKGVTEKFMVFRDKDIGIYEYWQAHIHEARNDEDVETDEEQKIIALNFCINEVREGLQYIKKHGKDAFINFNRYNYFFNKKKVNKVMETIENNLQYLKISKEHKKKK